LAQKSWKGLANARFVMSAKERRRWNDEEGLREPSKVAFTGCRLQT
jgi:hypothetical protein|tara:strand:+ start:100 stop:237 length:138 start_codon:yes stop_codon:yes gene_type:complete